MYIILFCKLFFVLYCPFFPALAAFRLSTQTIPLYAYNMGWSTKLIGRSSAVTVLLFIFLMIICGIYFAVINKWEKEDSK